MDNEKKLSDYIDKLNEDKKPEEHGSSTDSPELAKLMRVVRQVRSIKEPNMPEADFPPKLTNTVKSRMAKLKPSKSKKYILFAGMTSVAAILIMFIMMNFILPTGRANIVYAMEEAFRQVKAYHGFIEIVQANAEGEQTTQAKLEVWADKEGRYYVKGLEGMYKDIVTVNNGKMKWQIRPAQNQVHIFPSFPDAYRFVFELGKEIEEMKIAISSKAVGEDIIAGRAASVIEVTPQGGVPYRIWIDNETKLPLQKQYGMQKALQYTITYTELSFSDAIPLELTAYQLPDDFSETNTNPEQLVNNIEEAQEAVGYIIKGHKNIPEGYVLDSIAIVPDIKAVKLYYSSLDEDKRVVIIQGKPGEEFKPVGTAILGKINDSTVEIQSPVQESLGVLGGGGLYAGMTDISSIRWQEAGFEYAVVGNASLEDLIAFTQDLTNGALKIPSSADVLSEEPQIKVEVNMEIEENDQKSVDAGSSPWKLDPAYVAQVFVSLKIYPQGITGEYPIKYENLEVIKNTVDTAIVEVIEEVSPIKRVYLKRLVRQDSTGIWTVIGYDPL